MTDAGRWRDGRSGELRPPGRGWCCPRHGPCRGGVGGLRSVLAVALRIAVSGHASSKREVPSRHITERTVVAPPRQKMAEPSLVCRGKEQARLFLFARGVPRSLGEWRREPSAVSPPVAEGEGGAGRSTGPSHGGGEGGFAPRGGAAGAGGGGGARAAFAVSGPEGGGRLSRGGEALFWVWFWSLNESMYVPGS